MSVFRWTHTITFPFLAGAATAGGIIRNDWILAGLGITSIVLYTLNRIIDHK